MIICLLFSVEYLHKLQLLNSVTDFRLNFFNKPDTLLCALYFAILNIVDRSFK